MVINRQELLDKLYFGKVKLVNTIMPPGLVGYNSNAPQISYDQQKARQLLAEAGYPNGFSMVMPKRQISRRHFASMKLYRRC